MKHLLAVLAAWLLAGQGVFALAADDDVQAVPADSSLCYDALFLEAMVQRQKGNSDAAFDLLQRCVELNPDASEAYFFLSQYYAAMKDERRSYECIKKATEIDSDNSTYLETLAQVDIQQKRFADATNAVEKLYEKDKSRVDLLEMLYRLYQQQEEYTKAIDVLTRIESIDGKNERLAYAKSSLYTEMGNQEAAIAEMKSLADQYPNDLGYKGLYGDMLMMNGKEEEARQVFEQVLAEDPNNSRVQASMLSYLMAKEQTERADSMVSAILSNSATSTEQKIYLLRGIIQHNERQGGDSTQVLALFKKTLDVAEPDVDVAELFVAYMNLKQMPHDSIAPVLERILSVAPDNAAARLQLVSFAWNDGDRKRVIELCKAARQYNPDEMAFYYYQGIAHYQQEEHAEALSAFQNGIDVITEDSNPAIVADFYAVMGDLLHEEGRFKEAYEAYDSCLMHAPDNIGCMNNYAYFLSLDGMELDKAEQMSFKTVKAEPKNATYLDTYAWILFRQKRYSEARIYIEQALQNRNDSLDNSVVLEHAGDIYAMNDDMDMALKLWREALMQSEEKAGVEASRKQNKKLYRKIKQKKYLK